ncbi:LysR family transcriptional regulator [Mammaliicoccus sciuri]|uniref:LysR family transcriptional regulator n=1 Tax=Mammaliicoccus sciuri TaxID=1296 RepID=A0AAJ4VIM9_MAMSC|nr:LysR family transcriptional regulator [Mammaliicoccus sciuri]MCJ1782905.1 LysR family transcriptional regulator [Mammaliicoccus sciuri]RTX74175.1 LysR family transcriptional regulator [Mammaliicoccus sciuri]
MNIKQLKILKTLIETKSYTRTAEILNYTQSNVSQQINQLEAELKNELFIYSNKKLIESEFLLKILPLVNDYISTHDQIIKLSNEDMTHKLKIAAPESLVTTGLSEVIKIFLEKFPNTEFDLLNNTCSKNQALLMNGEVDIAFVINTGIQNNAIKKHKLSDDEIVIVAHHSAPDTLDELLSSKRYNHFVINEKDSTYRTMFEDFLSSNLKEVSKTTELWSIDAIKTFLIDDMGFSVLPYRTVEKEINSNKLKIIEGNDQFPTFYSFALTRKKNWDNNLIDLFIQEAKIYMGRNMKKEEK